MNLTRFQYAADWQAGSLANCVLDTVVNASAYGHAALEPQPVASFTTVTGAQAVGATQPPAVGLPTISVINTLGAGSTAMQTMQYQTIAYSYQAGDGIQFTTTTRAIKAQLAGTQQTGQVQTGATSGETTIRNGCIVDVIVDGTIVQTIDTANAAPVVQLFLDGNSHTVKIAHSGTYGTSVHPIAAVTATVGASVATQLLPTALAHPTFIAATWRVAATSSTAYSLFKTLPGGSETTVATGLLAGTHYSGASYVPGVDLYVGNGSALTTGDGATFTTDVVTFALESLAIGTGTGAGGAGYTTPLLDAGQTVQWFLAEWDQAPGFTLTDVFVATGESPTPDDTWTIFRPITPVTTTLPSGRTMGFAGLAASGVPRGRYCLLLFVFPTVSTVQPWLRDLMVYSWVPEHDPQILSKVGLPDEAQVGPVMGAYVGTLAVTNTELRQDVADFIGSYAITGAVDQYLAAHGADRGVPRYTAEQPTSYQTRLLAVSALRANAASVSGLCEQIALLVTGSSSGLVTSVSGGYQTATCQGVVVAQASGQQCPITIPPAPYAGLPGLSIADAQALIIAFIKLIQPLGTVIFPNNTSSLITFI